MKRFAFWMTGFVVLFIANALVELILLPLWGLDNSPKNDAYFIAWWAMVGVWLLFGNEILRVIEKSGAHAPDRQR